MSIHNDKNETSRFLGEGVSFKAKLIGILEVSEARGDRMCQEALSDLKMAIRAAGEHKQRITINIAIDGLRLRDEKTGDSLYHHPVHKISFIAQDMTDSRAFGYIFGSPDTGHRFFGIKTDKAASQVVIAMRDLFQVVFALKKKEIELAKQHLDKNRYTSSSIFSESSIGSNKALSQDSSTKTVLEIKSGVSAEVKSDTPAVADLVDLELELNSLQQGITQMERITPSDPFGSKEDPFGDSFTSYPPKPILPPPPSTRERSNRTSESGSMFSPKTPRTTGSVEDSSADLSLFNSDCNFNFSLELNSSHEEATNGDWFTPNMNNKIFDKPNLVPEPTQDQQHELTKQEILSQFDVFTELDPLGMSTGKIKPYIDKKDFFQELKNPPKKALNDLVSEKQPQESKLFQANFDKTPKLSSLNGSVFSSDPFGEDPFDKTDPFAETEFTKQDPFETESFVADYKMSNKDVKTVDFAEKLKVPTLSSETSFSSKFSISPNRFSGLEKQMSLVNQPVRSNQFTKQNTLDEKMASKISQIHENQSLDMSSESECAPEPPPRPTPNLFQIKPPPLPPKKQLGDFCTKPPPRPSYSDDSHYDYMDNYETGHTAIDFNKKFDKSPPLPAPARKVKSESDYKTPPQRPKKQFNVQLGWSSEEDYLTPISFANQNKEYNKTVTKNGGPILLPPPQRANKKHQPVTDNVIVVSLLESETNLTSTHTQETSIEGLDITLSQLTLSGLNEVASKLNIPASQLSNMTLVQLTEYISNFIKNKNENIDTSVPQFSDFKADFSNFNNFNQEPHDKYAVFRELLEEEIKQTKIDTEPEEHLVDRNKEEEKVINVDVELVNKNNDEKSDRYAALREIVDSEIIQAVQDDENVEKNNSHDLKVENENDLNNELTRNDTKINNENILNTEKLLEKEKIPSPNDPVIEYNTNTVAKEETLSTELIKSPMKVKSPVSEVVNEVVNEVIQSNNRLTSGSLSDVVSGSSPEVDNNDSTSDVKKVADVTGESWAIFDQPNLTEQINRDKQSEEGVSPWSSDSKEFGNGSPPDWRQRTDSGSGAERWTSAKRDQEGWWDTSAEPEVQYTPPNRRSTDSYEEEGEFYDRPPRRRRQMVWGTHGTSGQAAGGHSSSSRDASPWEEEPRRCEREVREHREMWTSRHARQQNSFERHRDRRHADSWDEEDDYDCCRYDEEHSGRYHWPERHGRDPEKERHMSGMRDRDSERWSDDWIESRRHRRRRETDRDRWCCPDWEQEFAYSSSRWRDRKHEERYYPRDPHESPWEEEYNNMPDESHSRYVTANKRNWKRPSSASEMDRKIDTKSRSGQYYMGTGGSDGERDRRYKVNRRSKSRDSSFSENTVQTRYKGDPNLPLRGPYRNKQHSVQKSLIEGEFLHDFPSTKLENSKLDNTKRSATLGNRKKTKENLKTEQLIHTFPRKTTFENNFVASETESPISASASPRFTFDNDFETSETESPIVLKCTKRHKNLFENGQQNIKSNLRYDTRKTTFKEDTRISPSRSTQKSPFEDDFSPPMEKPEIQLHKNISKSSIKEEMDDIENGEDDSFGTNNFDKSITRKKFLNKNRFSSNFHMDFSLKKSESVNIFARESDPFDDEFFSGKKLQDVEEDDDKSPRTSDDKWTENFEEYDFENRK